MRPVHSLTSSSLMSLPTSSCFSSLRHLRFSSSSSSFSSSSLPPFLYRPASSSTHRPASAAHLRPDSLLAELPDTSASTNGTDAYKDGPVELPPDNSITSNSLFAVNDDPTPLQVSTSVLLTGAITVFLFRSIRRRAKRAKEMKLRSSDSKKSLKDEALDSLKAIQAISVEPGAAPSPVQTLLGGITAGVIALILYKFTTTIEAALNRQTISDNYSVRQITVTIRTIINGLCYLATFVFGFNSIGLFLYSGQLAINSLFGGPKGENSRNEESKDQKMPTPPMRAETQNDSGVQSNKSDSNSDISQ